MRINMLLNNAGMIFGLLAMASLVVYAQTSWQGPVAAPPQGNTPAPLNVSASDQIKDGGLGVSRLGVFGNSYFDGNVGVGIISPAQKLDVAGFVRGAEGLCIVNDCRTGWPVGGGSPSQATRYWVGGSGEHYYCQDGDVACGVDLGGTQKGVWCCKMR